MPIPLRADFDATQVRAAARQSKDAAQGEATGGSVAI